MLNAHEQDTLINGSIAAKALIDLYGIVKRLNEEYDSTGGVKSTVTQDNLDLMTTWSGVTKGQTEDGMYVITTVIKGAIESSYSQLVQFASRVK